MTHQSYYRTYRPQSFADVVGQRHITQTLRNALADGTVAHAYLFTGPRGTGKTTVARILAKALNCGKGSSADPDITCQNCVDIAEGRHPDVYELDAASRTQVDNVREEIIGRLAYTPVRGTWKVYIIDEVHMLSNHSFNALLKTLEEPPQNTVFILCTTHPHKVPDTIHSRCQRLDFHRIGAQDIVERLSHICASEGINVAEGALALIAKHAAGGMRDAITILEQLSAFTNKDITLEDVEGLLGEVDVALLFELAGTLARRDIAAAFRFVERLAVSGVDMTEFVRDFTGHIRDLYVTSVVGDAGEVVDVASDHLARLTSQAREFGPTRLSRLLDLLGVLAGEIRWSSNPRLTLEVALVRMARPEGDLTLEALAERIEALENGARLAAPLMPASESAAAPKSAPASESAAAPKSVPARTRPQPAAPAEAVSSPAAEKPGATAISGDGSLDRASLKRAWPAVIAEIRRVKAARAHIFVNTEVDVDMDGKTLVVEFPADGKFTMELASDAETRQLLVSALARVLGAAPSLRYQLGRGPVRPVEKEKPPPVSVSPPPVDESEVEMMLINGLGAQMIAEHPNSSDESESQR